MLSIVIPVYNEEESLNELYTKINSTLSNLDKQYEIIFVNDGSSDNSQDIIDKLVNQHEQIHCITFRKNFGKSAALDAGFNHAKSDIIFTMDADLQDDPSEIPRFLEKIEQGADMVTGWKKNRLDPKEKTIPSKIFNLIISKISGLQLHDYNCGFKCYRRQVLNEIDLYGDLHRFVPFLAYKKGFVVKEIPVVHHERKFGVSKFGLERYARGFFDLLTVVFITGYISRPMHLLGLISSAFFGVGGVLFLYLFFGRWIQGESIGTSPLFMLSIFTLGSGVQIFVTSLLAEMIVYNRERQHKESYSIKSKSFEDH